MFADFQEAVVIVAGDALLWIAAGTLAGGLLLAMLHIVLGLLGRRPN